MQFNKVVPDVLILRLFSSWCRDTFFCYAVFVTSATAEEVNEEVQLEAEEPGEVHQFNPSLADEIQQGGPGCADSETEAARGVEEFFSAPQSLVPPPQLKKSTRKQDEAEVACSGGHPGCADVETDEVHGVEGQVSAPQSPIPPPGRNKLRHCNHHRKT